MEVYEKSADILSIFCLFLYLLKLEYSNLKFKPERLSRLPSHKRTRLVCIFEDNNTERNENKYVTTKIT